MSTLSPRADAVPARALPLLYFAVGYVALPLAFAVVAVAPRSVAGFFYHPRLIGIVHLVTLGWITAAILGALFIVLPVALKTPFPARRSDYWAFASFVIGVIGMVAHFWLEESGGMAWSGLMAAAAILHVGWRVVPRVLRAPIQGGVKLHVTLAFVNIALAAAAGVTIGFDKVYHFLPGYIIANVLAHAHLAALGWASMMALGIGYRLLPMVFGTSMPKGPTLYVSAILLEAGALGLFGALMLRSRWSVVFAACTVAAFGWFAVHLRGMRRHAPAAGLPRPDVGTWHALQAFAYLGVAAIVGLTLTVIEPSERALRFALVYGVCGLLGFLAQLVMGMEMRLVPMAAWYWTFVRTGDVPLFSAHALGSRRWAVLSFALWTAALPLVIAGFALDRAGVLQTGAAIGCAATLITGSQGLLVVRHAFAAPRWLSWTRAGARRRHSHQLAVPQGHS